MSLECLRRLAHAPKSLCFPARRFRRRGEIRYKVTSLARFPALGAGDGVWTCFQGLLGEISPKKQKHILSLSCRPDAQS